MPEEIDGSGAQNQESSDALALPPPAVDHTPQRLKQFRGAMDLVEDHKSIRDALEKQHGFGEAVSVVAIFKVEIDGVVPITDVKRQGGLTGLSRSDERDRRLQLQRLQNVIT